MSVSPMSASVAESEILHIFFALFGRAKKCAKIGVFKSAASAVATEGSQLEIVHSPGRLC